MKTTLIGVAFSILLLSCLLCGVPVIKANLVSSDGFTVAYQPYIVFPSNYGTYDSGFLTLNVSFHAMIYGNVKYYMTYSLDGEETELLSLVVYYYGSYIIDEEAWERNHIDGSALLPELSEGSHNITVYLECDWEIGNEKTTWHEYYYDTQTVYFRVKNTVSPTETPSPSPTADFPSFIVLPALIGATLMGALLFKKRKS
jgi:hypothetical protein